MAHLYHAYRCSLCRNIPEFAPIFLCPNRHHYCTECFRKLQRMDRGSLVDGISCCIVCNYTGPFEKSEVNTEFLRKLKIKPGIGRPFRYKFPFSSNQTHDVDVMPKIQGDCENVVNPRKVMRSVSVMGFSRRPLTCLHDGCNRSVAVASLLTHFRHDHSTVPCYGIERERELVLSFDVLTLEHDRTYCLGIITVYELNRIDVVRSRSSQSVINTCGRLSGRIPLNTFWLMVSSSSEYQSKYNSYAIFWLYSNCDERFWCTMEMSSHQDRISVSSFCSAVGLHEANAVQEIVRKMNCLIVTYGSFLALLNEGDKINLRVTIH